MIKLNDITKEYDIEGKNFFALDNINLKVEKGEFLAIVGPSGSGKTTLLNIIGLMAEPTKGRYWLDKYDTSKLSDDIRTRIRNEMIGFVFQNYNLIPDLTVEENVLLPTKYRRRSQKNHRSRKKHYKKRLSSVLNFLSIASKLRMFPRQLSGGEKQRVAIARAMINKPSIILADEPTGNLDSKAGEGVVNILKNLNKRGVTVIMVTHNEKLARKADRIISLKDGCMDNR